MAVIVKHAGEYSQLDLIEKKLNKLIKEQDEMKHRLDNFINGNASVKEAEEIEFENYDTNTNSGVSDESGY